MAEVVEVAIEHLVAPPSVATSEAEMERAHPTVAWEQPSLRKWPARIDGYPLEEVLIAQWR